MKLQAQPKKCTADYGLVILVNFYCRLSLVYVLFSLRILGLSRN